MSSIALENRLKTHSLAFLCGQKATVQMETLNIKDEFGCRRKRPLLVHLVNSETKDPLQRRIVTRIKKSTYFSIYILKMTSKI